MQIEDWPCNVPWRAQAAKEAQSKVEARGKIGLKGNAMISDLFDGHATMARVLWIVQRMRHPH